MIVDDPDEFLASLFAEVDETHDIPEDVLTEALGADLSASGPQYVPRAHFLRPRTVDEPWCVLRVYTSRVGGKHRVVHMVMRGLTEEDAVEYAALERLSHVRDLFTVVTEKALRESGVPLPRLRRDQ